MLRIALRAGLDRLRVCTQRMEFDFLHRRILIAVLAVVSHPWTTLAVVFLTAAASAAAAIGWLTISTDQNRLFSSRPWFFHDYLQFIQRFPENEALYVVIEPKRGLSVQPPIALDRRGGSRHRTAAGNERGGLRRLLPDSSRSAWKAGDPV